MKTLVLGHSDAVVPGQGSRLVVGVVLVTGLQPLRSKHHKTSANKATPSTQTGGRSLNTLWKVLSSSSTDIRMQLRFLIVTVEGEKGL